MGIDIKTLAAAKKYTKGILEGITLIEGKPCTISSIADITGGKRITFRWTADDGTTKTDTLDVMNGDKGEKGDKGDTGNTGATGPTGATGVDGEAATIEIGTVTSGDAPSISNSGTSHAAVFNFTLPKGDKGDKGDTGEDGQDGKSFEIKAQYTTYADLIAAHPTGNAGDAYFVGEGTSPDLYTWLSDDQTWYNNGPIAGVKGDKGDTGDDGYSPTAKVTKSGKIVTITIIDKNGQTTETVSDGADGADGNDGNDGKSAYEVAVEEGFVGTEAEWLESLKGEDGVPGANGTNGTDGISPIANVSESGGIITIHIQDASGTTETKIDLSKYPEVVSCAGSHNRIFRGKALGSSVTAAQYTAIAAGTFDDMYIGDYWTIGGVNYRIAAFDYWLHCGDTECTTHHVVLVPDTNLYTAAMNSSNVTTGGYTSSAMCTSNLANAKSTINSAFGSAHILNHRELFTTSVASDGKANNWAWKDSTVDLMNECMVYGHNAWGSHHGYETGIDKSQLPLFAMSPDRITNRSYWWLRDVVSASAFAGVGANGGCSYNGASNTSIGVRPAFAICAA